MNQKICIFFTHRYKRIKIPMYFFQDTIVEDALCQFLAERYGHSIFSLEDFIFLYKTRVLNSKEFINKKLLNIFHKNDPTIIFFEYEDPIGGGDSIEFCDVSNGKQELINSNIIYGTPNKGINIYGLCQEKNCIAYNQEVVVPINKNYFDLLSQKHDLKCPKCNNIIIPNTVGFLQCEYKVKGKKIVKNLILKK